jgi:hypothetical protein
MAKHWYRIDIDPQGKRSFCGSSPFDLNEMGKQLSTAKYIQLDDLFYRDSDSQLRPWQDWEPRLLPTALIQCSAVVSVMPFDGVPTISKRGGPSDGPA